MDDIAVGGGAFSNGAAANGGLIVDDGAGNEDFSKLSTQQKLAHSNWKARKEGLDAVAADASSTNGNKEAFFAALPKLIKESNPSCLEAFFDAIISVFGVLNDAEVSSLEGDILKLVVEKGITGRPKAVTSCDRILKGLVAMPNAAHSQTVQQRLSASFSHKTPKNRQVGATAIAGLIETFGPMKFNLKQLMKDILPLFGDQNAAVRKEAQNFAVQVYRHIGPGINSFLSELRDVQTAELQKMFESAKPVASAGGGGADEGDDDTPNDGSSSGGGMDKNGGGGGGAGGGNGSYIFPNPPKDAQMYANSPDTVLKMHKDLLNTASDKSVKWQDRNKAAQDLFKPLQTAFRLRSTDVDYTDLVKFMRDFLNDPQVPLNTTSFKAIQDLARTLRESLSPYVRHLIPAVFDKFKDKKTPVIEHVYTTLGMLLCYRCCTFEQLQEEIDNAMASKIPHHRMAIITWLNLIVPLLPPQTVKARLAKAQHFSKLLADEKTDVKEGTLVLIGKIIASCGQEGSISPAVMNSLDQKQMLKVRQAMEGGGSTASASSASAVSRGSNNTNSNTAVSDSPNKMRRATVGGAFLPSDLIAQGPPQGPPANGSSNNSPSSVVGGGSSLMRSPRGAAASTGPSPSSSAPASRLNVHRRATYAGGGGGGQSSGGGAAGGGFDYGDPGSFEGQMPSKIDAYSIISNAVAQGGGEESVMPFLASKEWAKRQSAVSAIESIAREGWGPAECAKLLDALIIQFQSDPSFKESIFQVNTAMISCFTFVARTASSITNRGAFVLIQHMGHKLSDMKCKGPFKELLTALAEGVGIRFVIKYLTALMSTLNQPKLSQEGIEWITRALFEFPRSPVDHRVIIKYVKTNCFENATTPPAVKSAAVQLVVAVRQRVGSEVDLLLVDVNPHLRTTIGNEINKCVFPPPDMTVRNVKPTATEEALPESSCGMVHMGPSSSSPSSANSNPFIAVTNAYGGGAATASSSTNNTNNNGPASSPSRTRSASNLKQVNVNGGGGGGGGMSPQQRRPSGANGPANSGSIYATAATNNNTMNTNNNTNAAMNVNNGLLSAGNVGGGFGQQQQGPSQGNISARGSANNNNIGAASDFAGSNNGGGIGLDGDASQALAPIVKEIVNGADWKVRLNAVKKVESLLKPEGRTLSANAATEVLKALRTRFDEVNKNLIVDVLRSMNAVVDAAGTDRARVGMKYVLPYVLNFLGDQKQQLRDEATYFCQIAFQSLGAENVLPYVAKPLTNEAQFARLSIVSLLEGLFEQYVQAQEQSPTPPPPLRPAHVAPLIPPLLRLLMDRLGDVRQGAEHVLIYVIHIVGVDVVNRAVNDMRQQSDKQQVKVIVERCVQQVALSSPQQQQEDEDGEEGDDNIHDADDGDNASVVKTIVGEGHCGGADNGQGRRGAQGLNYDEEEAEFKPAAAATTMTTTNSFNNTLYSADLNNSYRPNAPTSTAVDPSHSLAMQQYQQQMNRQQQQIIQQQQSLLPHGNTNSVAATNSAIRIGGGGGGGAAVRGANQFNDNVNEDDYLPAAAATISGPSVINRGGGSYAQIHGGGGLSQQQSAASSLSFPATPQQQNTSSSMVGSVRGMGMSAASNSTNSALVPPQTMIRTPLASAGMLTQQQQFQQNQQQQQTPISQPVVVSAVQPLSMLTTTTTNVPRSQPQQRPPQQAAMAPSSSSSSAAVVDVILNSLENGTNETALNACNDFMTRFRADPSSSAIADGLIITALCNRLRRTIGSRSSDDLNTFIQQSVDPIPPPRTGPVDLALASALTESLTLIFNTPQALTSLEVLTLTVVFNVIIDSIMSEPPDQLVRALNNFALGVVMRSPSDVAYRAMILCLADYTLPYLNISNQINHKYMTLILKCLMRLDVTRLSPSVLISASHDYLEVHPPSHFRSKDDLAIRTIKTKIQTMCGLHGQGLLQLAEEEGGPSSVIVHLVRAALDAVRNANATSNNSPPNAPPLQPPQAQAQAAQQQTAPQQPQPQQQQYYQDPMAMPSNPPNVVTTASVRQQQQQQQQRPSLSYGGGGGSARSNSPQSGAAMGQQQQNVRTASPSKLGAALTSGASQSRAGGAPPPRSNSPQSANMTPSSRTAMASSAARPGAAMAPNANNATNKGPSSSSAATPTTAPLAPPRRSISPYSSATTTNNNNANSTTVSNSTRGPGTVSPSSGGGGFRQQQISPSRLGVAATTNNNASNNATATASLARGASFSSNQRNNVSAPSSAAAAAVVLSTAERQQMVQQLGEIFSMARKPDETALGLQRMYEFIKSGAAEDMVVKTRFEKYFTECSEPFRNYLGKRLNAARGNDAAEGANVKMPNIINETLIAQGLLK